MSRERTLKEKQQSNGRTLALNGTAWRKLRAAVLRESPLCALCRTATATEVDHVDDDPTNNDRANLSALCKPCHSRKTNADRGHNVTFRLRHPRDAARPESPVESRKITSNRNARTDWFPFRFR